MPESINSLHTIVTLIALGILFGAGFGLVQLAITWPMRRVAAGAAVICVLVVVLAWVM